MGPFVIAAHYVFLEIASVNICLPHPQCKTFHTGMFPQTGQTFWWDRHKNSHKHTHSAKHTPLMLTVSHKVSIKPPMCNVHHHYTLYQGTSGKANQDKHSCIPPPCLSFCLIKLTDMHMFQITTLQWKMKSAGNFRISNKAQALQWYNINKKIHLKKVHSNII